MGKSYFLLSGNAISALGAIGPGDVFHVPGDAKHAWRNRSDEPAVQIVITTARIGRFFRAIGTRVQPGGVPAAAGPLSPEAIHHFIETSERHGYWNATPEENAATGIAGPPGVR